MLLYEVHVSAEAAISMEQVDRVVSEDLVRLNQLRINVVTLESLENAMLHEHKPDFLIRHILDVIQICLS